jgi:branched-subunit amino acid aminotransferase/4-amino-4-deoxychorismate lyase
MTIWIDGKLLGGTDVPRPSAFSPFETMAAQAGQVKLWDRHLARLAAAAERLSLPFRPSMPELRSAAADLLLHNGHGDDVLRLQLVPDGGSVRTVMASRARSPLSVVKLLPTVVKRPADAPPADLKCEPRRFYDLVRQQAQDGGADDGLVVADDGAVLETALGNLWLLLDGEWVTPPLDGRVMPGIARAALLEQAVLAGVRTAERACGLGDVHRAEALAHSNAVYGPRPAVLLGPAGGVGKADSRPVRGPADSVIVAGQLGAVWRSALGEH